MPRPDPLSQPHYGTHVGPLLATLQDHPEGSVLEMGAGVWSSPLLHQLCEFTGRRLVTVEQNPKWLRYFQTYATENHRLVDYEDESEWLTERYAVALIDHSKDRRGPDLLRIDAGAYVVHDTEPNHHMVYPGLHDALATFPHREDYTVQYPHAAVVSR